MAKEIGTWSGRNSYNFIERGCINFIKTYLEKLEAFVIESADNINNAVNGALEEGNLYYIDASKDAMLRQFRRVIVAYYMN